MGENRGGEPTKRPEVDGPDGKPPPEWKPTRLDNLLVKLLADTAGKEPPPGWTPTALDRLLANQKLWLLAASACTAAWFGTGGPGAGPGDLRWLLITGTIVCAGMAWAVEPLNKE